MNRYVLPVLLSVAFILIVSVNVFALEFPGSAWGELRYENPVHSVGAHDLILRGWIKQGIELARWNNVNLNTYATIRYVWDSEQFDWNNSVGPGLGVAVDMYNPKGLVMSWGIEYLWDRFYRSDHTEQKAVVFMNWYGWWNLKKK